MFKTLLISLSGGLFFQFLHFPLPWMLGTLTAVALWQCLGKGRACWPLSLRNIGLMALGYLLGITFTRETLGQIMEQLPSMFLTTLLVMAFSLIMAYFISHRTGLNLPTSLIGCIPGGLSQMVVLSEEIEGADRTVVTFMQTIRLLAVIFIIPFLTIHGLNSHPNPVTAASLPVSPENAVIILPTILISTWLALQLKLPTPFLVGPLLGGALLVLNGLAVPPLPHFLLIAAQLCVGTYMGFTIQPANVENWKSLLPYVLLSSISLVLFSLLTGYLLTVWHSIKLTTAFLSTSPGGMTEMGVTAALVHADVSIVSAYQMFRLLFILFIVPYALKFGLYCFRQKNIDNYRHI